MRCFMLNLAFCICAFTSSWFETPCYSSIRHNAHRIACAFTPRSPPQPRATCSALLPAIRRATLWQACMPAARPQHRALHPTSNVATATIRALLLPALPPAVLVPFSQTDAVAKVRETGRHRLSWRLVAAPHWRRNFSEPHLFGEREKEAADVAICCRIFYQPLHASSVRGIQPNGGG